MGPAPSIDAQLASIQRRVALLIRDQKVGRFVPRYKRRRQEREGAPGTTTAVVRAIAAATATRVVPAQGSSEREACPAPMQLAGRSSCPAPGAAVPAASEPSHSPALPARPAGAT